jgi:hypothetical protein
MDKYQVRSCLSASGSITYDPLTGVIGGGGGGGGVTGSGVAGQIAFWSGTSAITGENALWYDSTNDRVGIGTNSPTTDLLIQKATIGNPVEARVYNTDNTDGASHAHLTVITGGSGGTSSGGDPHVLFAVNTAQNFALGIDNSVSGKPFKLSWGANLGTNDVMTVNQGGDMFTLNNIIGGSTARGTRLTIVNSSDNAAVQNLVIRNAADSANRLIIYGDGNIKSLPSNLGFNASNELQLHIENTGGTAANVGISLKGPNSHMFITNNQANQDVRIGQVVSGTPQTVLSFRYNNDFRAATVRGLSTTSATVGLTLLNTGPNREWGILVGNTSNAILGTGGLGFLDITSDTFAIAINGTTRNVGIGAIVATARLHIRAGSATASTAPLKFTTGTILTTAEAGAMEYNNTFHLTNSDATRRHIVTAPNTTKVTAGAPYANDGYIVMNIGGTDFKIMTTA